MNYQSSLDDWTHVSQARLVPHWEGEVGCIDVDDDDGVVVGDDGDGDGDGVYCFWISLKTKMKFKNTMTNNKK